MPVPPGNLPPRKPASYGLRDPCSLKFLAMCDLLRMDEERSWGLGLSVLPASCSQCGTQKTLGAGGARLLLTWSLSLASCC